MKRREREGKATKWKERERRESDEKRRGERRVCYERRRGEK